MDIVDAHCHIISPDTDRYPRRPIGGTQSEWATTRPVTAARLLDRMDEVGIGQAILVQATTAYGYDNAYVRDSQRRWPDRFVAVGTFDPLEADAGARLAALVGDDGLAGVRLFTAGSTVARQGEWFAAPETYEFWEAAGEAGVPVCVQMRLGEATPRLVSVLERFPAVRVVLDHLGYPDIAGSPERAGAEVATLARYPRLHLKLTHRNLERLRDAGPRAADFLLPVVEAFGGERIVWGSNCPAAEQPLAELVELATDVLAALPAATRGDVFAGSARRLYPSLVRAIA